MKFLKRTNTHTPLDFKEGLCGIGWGIDYLIHHGLLEGDPDEILEDLDKLIFSCDIETCTDTSFETGSEGIKFYHSYRKGENISSYPGDMIFIWGNTKLN